MEYPTIVGATNVSVAMSGTTNDLTFAYPCMFEGANKTNANWTMLTNSATNSIDVEASLYALMKECGFKIVSDTKL